MAVWRTKFGLKYFVLGLQERGGKEGVSYMVDKHETSWCGEWEEV